jgi:hypothetical protein
VSDPTSSPAAAVADTIMRTVELGVTITDAAVDNDATVVFCNLLSSGRQSCPGCGSPGIYRDIVTDALQNRTAGKSPEILQAPGILSLQRPP